MKTAPSLKNMQPFVVKVSHFDTSNYFLILASDTESNTEDGSASGLSVQPCSWNSEKDSVGMLLVKYHLKICADIIQIYIERSSWFLESVPLGLDSSMQGHNHLALQKRTGGTERVQP